MHVASETTERLPAGQVLTQKWPVLTYGDTPRIALGSWSFRCLGAVGKEVAWTWTEFLALPRVEITSDIHCVTRWSRFDNRWTGVAVRELLRHVDGDPRDAADACRRGASTSRIVEVRRVMIGVGPRSLRWRLSNSY